LIKATLGDFSPYVPQRLDPGFKRGLA